MASPSKTAGRNRRGRGSAKARRSAARLAAVQALYQIELASADTEAVVAEFIKHRLGHEVDGVSYVAAEPVLFSAIVRGTRVRLADVGEMVSAALDPRLPFDRVELLLRAILCAGAFELLAHGDVHPRIIISEYVEIAHAFYQGREVGLINGVLDHLARRLRADELATPEPRDDEPAA